MKPISNVIGIIDSNGAIHYQKLRLGDVRMHEEFWPTRTHKRWRFEVSEWNISNSALSEKLDIEEQDNVLALMRKILTPPEWFLHSEAWDKAGRPRSKAHDKFEREYERAKKRRVINNTP